MYKKCSTGFATFYALTETIIKAIPLPGGAGGVTGFSMNLEYWAEGQIYMGAFAASGLAVYMATAALPADPLTIGDRFLAGVSGG